jgi:hypothetical protein
MEQTHRVEAAVASLDFFIFLEPSFRITLLYWQSFFLHAEVSGIRPAVMFLLISASAFNSLGPAPLISFLITHGFLAFLREFKN